MRLGGPISGCHIHIEIYCQTVTDRAKLCRWWKVLGRYESTFFCTYALYHEVPTIVTIASKHSQYICIMLGCFSLNLPGLCSTICGLFLLFSGPIPAMQCSNNRIGGNGFCLIWQDCRFDGFFPLDEAVASRAVFVIVSGSDGRAETFLEVAK